MRLIFLVITTINSGKIILKMFDGIRRKSKAGILVGKEVPTLDQFHI